MDTAQNGFKHHEFEKIQGNGSLKRQKKNPQNLFKLSFGICSRFQTDSVPPYWSHRGRLAPSSRQQSVAALLIVAEQSEVGVFRESRVGQLGGYYTITG